MNKIYSYLFKFFFISSLLQLAFKVYNLQQHLKNINSGQKKRSEKKNHQYNIKLDKAFNFLYAGLFLAETVLNIYNGLIEFVLFSRLCICETLRMQ